MTLYSKVAQDFEQQIREGMIQPGQKLPSVRQLSRNREVSASTVLQAYMILEARGLIEAKPQSGYYACAPLAAASPLERPKPMVRYGNVETSDLVATMRKASNDADFYQLGCALMVPSNYPIKRLSRLMSHAVKNRPESLVRMDFPPGNARLRKQIARRYGEIGTKVGIEDIVLTSGCNEAITLALRAATKPGDAVLVESPAYFGVLEILRDMGLKVVEVSADACTGLQLDSVRDAFRRFPIKAGFVAPNFSNPSGALMPDENKRELVDMFARNKAWLIEDDIFSELSHSHIRPKPLRAFDTKGIVITCSSFSKTIGPGLRIGWVLPGSLREEIEGAKYLLNGGTTLAMTELVADFLESGSYERYLRRVRQTIAVQVARVSEAVIRAFPEGTRISQPQGGYVIWVRLPDGYDSVQLYRKAMSAKINFAPGVIFSASGKFSDHVRISCGDWSEATRKAIVRLGGLL